MTETNPSAVWPTLQAHDAPVLIKFLTDVLGFRAHAVFTAENDDDVVVHAELLWPGGGGVMLGTYKPNNEACNDPGTTSVYLVSDAVDAIHDRAVDARASIVQPLHKTDYGSREFSLRDPEGNNWSIGTYGGQPVS